MPINASRILRWLFIVLGGAVVLFAIYTWGTLQWSYSSGRSRGICAEILS